MQLGSFLIDATQRLRSVGVDSARLDVLILLEDVLDKDRASLIAHPEILLSEAHITILNTYITQRSRHVPLAYIRGQSAFYGREFVVNTHTLVPRPESEAMINLLKKLELSGHPHIADIGTGSGCLGITAALEIPRSVVFVYDISTEALKVTVMNARRLNARVQAAEQDLLVGDTHRYDVLLANLPYVPVDYPINEAARHEPPVALFSGTDGLEHYRRLWQEIAISRPRYVITEALVEQHPQLEQIADKASYLLSATDGLAQCFTYSKSLR